MKEQNTGNVKKETMVKRVEAAQELGSKQQQQCQGWNRRNPILVEIRC